MSRFKPGYFPEAIIAAELINSWASYTALAAGTVGYYKDAEGMVRLTGAINAGTAGTVAFVLPAGYRPLATNTYFSCASSGANVARVDINSNGNVTITVLNTWVALNNVCFRTR